MEPKSSVGIAGLSGKGGLTPASHGGLFEGRGRQEPDGLGGSGKERGEQFRQETEAFDDDPGVVRQGGQIFDQQKNHSIVSVL